MSAVDHSSLRDDAVVSASSQSSSAEPAAAAGSRTAFDAPTLEPRLPSGPRAPGLVQMRRWFRDPVSFIEGNKDRYGPNFRVKLGALKRCAMIGDPETAWTVLSGDQDVFRMGPTNNLFRPVLGERSLFLLDGEEHRHQRRLLAPPFHPRSIAGYRHLLEEIAAREIATWPTGEPFRLQGPMRRITTESIVRIVIGVCSPERDATIRRLVPEMLEIAENPLALMPQFQHEMGGRSPFGKVMDVTRRLEKELYDEIGLRRHLAEHERGSDVLSMLTAAPTHDPAYMTDSEVRDQMITLLVAGHETTANALSWSFERILRHPAVHDTLVAGLGDDADPYLDAVVRETLRQRPILPVTARRLTEDREVGELTFPRGWTLMPCIYLIHQDPRVFPEPDKFRPERFLEDPKPSSRVWVPFGAGSRHCVGSHLALMTIKTVISTVLDRTVLEANDEPEPIVRNNMTLAPGYGATATLVGPRRMRTRSSAPAPAGS